MKWFSRLLRGHRCELMEWLRTCGSPQLESIVLHFEPSSSWNRPRDFQRALMHFIFTTQQPRSKQRQTDEKVFVGACSSLVSHKHAVRIRSISIKSGVVVNNLALTKLFTNALMSRCHLWCMTYPETHCSGGRKRPTDSTTNEWSDNVRDQLDYGQLRTCEHLVG